MIIWITGMSGSGKTTLGTEIIRLLREREINNAVLIDGDNFRRFFSVDLGYSLEDRKENERRIYQLCSYLDSQNIHVICAVLSLFPEYEELNRKNFDNYCEIYIDVPFSLLVNQRDYKGLYREALTGKKTNVVGVDIKFDVPKNPDIVISNTASKEDFLLNAQKIITRYFAKEWELPAINASESRPVNANVIG